MNHCRSVILYRPASSLTSVGYREIRTLPVTPIRVLANSRASVGYGASEPTLDEAQSGSRGPRFPRIPPPPGTAASGRSGLPKPTDPPAQTLPSFGRLLDCRSLGHLLSFTRFRAGHGTRPTDPPAHKLLSFGWLLGYCYLGTLPPFTRFGMGAGLPATAHKAAVVGGIFREICGIM